MNKEVIIDIENPKDNDLISRQAAIEELNTINGTAELDKAFEVIERMPSVKPQEPKTGHWIIIDDCEKFIAKCSECGQIEDSRMIGKYAYCHCGAKIIEPQESEEV